MKSKVTEEIWMHDHLPMHSLDVTIYATGGRRGMNRRPVCIITGEGPNSCLVEERDANVRRILEAKNGEAELRKLLKKALLIIYEERVTLFYQQYNTVVDSKRLADEDKTIIALRAEIAKRKPTK